MNKKKWLKNFKKNRDPFYSYVSLKNHTHQNLNCRCKTTPPIDGQIKVKFDVDTKPFISATRKHNMDFRETINKKASWRNNDTSWITPMKITNKKEEKRMYKKDDFEIVNGALGGFGVKRKDEWKWISVDGKLSTDGEKDYVFQSRKEAEQALEDYLAKQNGELYLELESLGSHKGVVGEKTPFTDLRGEVLYVGDTVESFGGGKSFGENAVCNDRNMYGFLVMGLAGCNFTNGISKNNYAILKTKSYKDLKVGDNIDGIVVKAKETKEMRIEEIEAKLGYKIKVVGND